MKIQKIQNHTNFKSQNNTQNTKKPEFIDKFMNVVQNQDDVNDCVAVPRGIFKAFKAIGDLGAAEYNMALG